MIPYHHLRHQLPVIASLAGTAVAALRPRRDGAPLALPSPEIVRTIAPRPAALVRSRRRRPRPRPFGW